MSSIITFYSYKGGVGRSMALSNVAFELSKRSKKVLIVDWDLEAPGLEKYFSNYSIIGHDKSGNGLLQLLIAMRNGDDWNYQQYTGTLNPSAGMPLTILGSGRDKDSANYSSLLEKFDWENFFSEKKGGLHLENLRNQWLNDFDFVLIDSRTGLSDSSGICTIMMPDVLIPMFTANYQSLFGVRDIISYIQNARQHLKVDRMALTILPVPSRFGTRVEFKESQEWLDRIADILKGSFSTWLPKWIEPRYILEQVKIPQVDYFSFGEKLAVVEQGTNDPEGMGYVYAKIATLLASEFRDIESFVGKEYYILKKQEFDSHQSKDNQPSKSEFKHDVFISYSRDSYPWVKELFLPALTEYLNDELGYNPEIFVDYDGIRPGESSQMQLLDALNKSRTLLVINNSQKIDNESLNFMIEPFLRREQVNDAALIFPILLKRIEEGFDVPDLYVKRVIDFSLFNYEETLKSTRLRAAFGHEVENLAKAIANSIKKESGIDGNETKIKHDSRHDVLLQLASEYDYLRKKLPSGNNRTSQMESVVSRMKAILADSKIDPSQFMSSESPGKRLIAIASLQVAPNLKYLPWLVEHVGDVEKPFIGYQASVALYISSRAFAKTNRELLLNTLDTGLKNIRKYSYQDINQIDTIEIAKKELLNSTQLK
jgi:cellulose biosynthesis protein BcsQ